MDAADVPPDLEDLVVRAGRAADLLAAVDRRIAFCPPGDDGVIARLEDGAGNVVRPLRAFELFELLDGLDRR